MAQVAEATQVAATSHRQGVILATAGPHPMTATATVTRRHGGPAGVR